MKTQGEIEGAICQNMRRLQQEFLGRGPRNVYAHLLDDIILVRLKGVLTAVEVTLINSDRGKSLLKEVREELMKTVRPLMEKMVEEVANVAVIGLHHDISTSGDEVVLFTLASAPCVR